MTREWPGAYRLFLYYFTHNLDYVKTIQYYSLLEVPRPSSSDYMAKWSTLKKQYPEEYFQAKNAYLDSIGLTQASVFTKIINIANNAVRDVDKLRALELVLRYKDEIADSSALSALNKLTVEVIDNNELSIEEV